MTCGANGSAEPVGDVECCVCDGSAHEHCSAILLSSMQLSALTDETFCSFRCMNEFMTCTRREQEDSEEDEDEEGSDGAKDEDDAPDHDAGPVAGAKRRRRAYTSKEKRVVVAMLGSATIAAIQRHTGIPRSTITNWAREQDAIKNFTGGEAPLKTQRTTGVVAVRPGARDVHEGYPETNFLLQCLGPPSQKTQSTSSQVMLMPGSGIDREQQSAVSPMSSREGSEQSIQSSFVFGQGSSSDAPSETQDLRGTNQEASASVITSPSNRQFGLQEHQRIQDSVSEYSQLSSVPSNVAFSLDQERSLQALISSNKDFGHYAATQDFVLGVAVEPIHEESSSRSSLSLLPISNSGSVRSIHSRNSG